MKTYICTLFLLASVSLISAQPSTASVDPSLDILPPSPTAAALTKYVDYPVTYHTGAPQVSVPIHTLTGKGLALPVSLSYHAGGVKVDEVSTKVGLGWSLNAGGMVSRTIRGFADEYGNGYMEKRSSIPYPVDLQTNFDALVSIANGDWDGQPDLFNFSAGGYSGKFVFEDEQTVRLIPHQDLKVEYTRCSNNCGSLGIPEEAILTFTITTPDGIKYTFGTTDGLETSEMTSYSIIGGNCNVKDYSLPAVTGWHLKSIYNPQTDDQIVLNYSAAQITYDISYNESFSYPSVSPQHQDCQIGATSSKCVSTKKDRTPFLESIESLNGKVEFKHASRNDVLVNFGKSRIEEIEIKGKTGGLLKSYKLIQNFITSSGSTPSTDPKSSVRMYLDEVEEYSASGIFINQHSFTYNDRNQLPPRLSYKQDHWGYPNSNSQNQMTQAPNPYALSQLNNYFLGYQDANRSVDPAKATLGVLNQVILPTGGIINYEFESNTIGICDYIEEYESRTETADAIYNGGPVTVTQNFTLDFDQDVDISYVIDKIEIRQLGAYVKLIDLASGQTIFEKGLTYAMSTPITLSGIETMYLSAGDYQLFAIAQAPADPAYPYPFNVQPERATITTFFEGTVSHYYENKPTGGIRVKRIHIDDNDGNSANDIVKKFDYHKDVSGCDKSTAKYYGRLPQYMSNGVYIVPTEVPCDFRECYSTQISASSLLSLTNYGGNIVGYEEVWELLGDQAENGKNYYKYRMFDDLDSELGPHHFGIFLNSPMIDMSFKTGKLVEQNKYDHQGNILSSTQNNYEFEETTNYHELKAMVGKKLFSLPCPQNPTITCDENNINDYWLVNCKAKNYILFTLYQCDKLYHPCYGRPVGTILSDIDALYEYTYEYYDVISQWVYLKETTQRQYSPGTNDYVETITTYNYDIPLGRHTNVTSTVVTNSDGKETRTEQKYAPELLADNPGNTVFQDMIDRNMLGIQLETIQKVDNSITGGSKVDFSFYSASGTPTSSNSGRPPMAHQFHRYEVTWDENGTKVDNGWDLQATIDEYTTDGLLKQVTVDGWSPEIYTWTDGQMTQKAFLNYTWSYTYDSNSRLMTSMTDIDGQVTNYTYDQSMRLATASARGGNVLTTYTYHYKNGSTDHNWIETKINFTPVAGSSLTEQTTRQYLDGLGRPIQTVQVKHSPAQKDIATQVDYDAHGRVIRQYVPYESAYDDGRFVTVPSSVKYTETAYENSPLNRVKEVTPPSWYTTISEYSVNDNGEVVNPMTNTAYPASSLTKVVVTDPNNNKSITFTDKLGRQILSRKTDASGANVNDTYYDYDDKNRLRTVVPPGATVSSTDLLFKYVYDGLDNMVSKKVPSQAEIVTLYNIRNQPTYTQDGNMASQGKWMMTKYDTYGRVSETGFYQGTPTSGDAINNFSERLTKTNYGTSGITEGKVTYTESKVLGTSNTFIKNWLNYDAYGRMNYSRGNNHRYTNYTYAEYNTTSFDFADNIMSTYRRHHGNTTAGFTYIYEDFTYDHSGRQQDYEHRLNSGAWNLISQNEYNYRDFLTRKLLHETSANNFLQNIDYYYNDQGWLTQINDFCEPTPADPGGGGDPIGGGGGFGSMVIDLEFNDGEINEQSAKINYRISIDAEVVDSKGNKAQKTFKRTVETTGLTSDELVTRYVDESEAAQLKFNTKIQLDYSDTRIAAAQYADFLLTLEQQVIEKLDKENGIKPRMGLMVANEVQSAVEFTAPIAAPAMSQLGGGGGNQEDDLFAMKIYYDTPNTTLNALEQRNGNISHMGWQVGCNDEQWYGFAYDHLDRITNAQYAEVSYSSGNYINSNRYNVYGLSYDTRGNILGLRRRGRYNRASYGDIDFLTYTYAGNQLQSIQESQLKYEGFKSVHPGTTGTYTYDANGNLKSDQHKAITNIDYNHLNLPERIDFANGDFIEWTYDANGTKLKKTTSAGNTKDYAGNVEYDNNIIEAIYHPEGRCTPDGSGWQYEYTLRDHLGNSRVTFADLDGSNDVDETEILQQNHYYPFGMNMRGAWSPTAPNKYQYNGKELNEEFGLGWLSYGFRWYDPAIGRFPSIDPVAEDFVFVSPYNYAENEPIGHIDLWGLQKHKPEINLIDKPSELISFKTANNLYEGVKTVTIEAGSVISKGINKLGGLISSILPGQGSPEASDFHDNSNSEIPGTGVEMLTGNNNLNSAGTADQATSKNGANVIIETILTAGSGNKGSFVKNKLGQPSNATNRLGDAVEKIQDVIDATPSSTPAQASEPSDTLYNGVGDFGRQTKTTTRPRSSDIDN